ncbi:uncharacterized protein LACBIDRAFT_191382 [Laccaria bicolor S238N-H82]|uniref:Predicted protein n=1 Tax=Laccaria bicolor (strain S238N-H82 / ATCC MYA-4686) TaxID=486041 RepID=B0DMP9_LACBS|nr:uncharacterized protein LACBIDRAFT_191382 [Laccaria bicolor S238N-H82]EDR04007.1 predicted protein [Laccaria bicolor S238N-H82]|eukprot:XP_001885262.1 predicted protein [Laccaria bicolor S238N-H82]
MGLTGLTVDIPSSTSKRPDEKRPAARWSSFEFKVYYALACIVIPIMVWIPVSLSSPSNPNYPFYQMRLSNGWLFGRRIDNSDAQYRSFRNNLPPLLIGALAFLLSKFLRVHYATVNPGNNLYLIPFNVGCSLVMILALHGTSALKVLAIVSANYGIAKMCRGSRAGPALTWMFNAAVLFLNERYGGYRFGDMIPGLEYLDTIQGAYPRWHVSFNITMLRLVSFSMDHYWACQPLRSPSSEDTGSAQLSEKQRQSMAHPEGMYSYMNYIAYVLYPPLYIAGPIMTFNDFIWQHRRPTPISTQTTIKYLLRFVVSFMTMEFILHFMYVVAIKDRKAWVGASPAQISMIGFWNLMIVWLKLLIPWRFFRLWALMDGIDPPENMVRCMANNYSTLGFWRSWHRSYNLWVIRYIYIPLGGANNVVVNTVLVFSFVALWHDLTFRLLAWGWLVSLFIIPELCAVYLLPASKFGQRPWYRHVCALGAVFNIMMMMAANLVGFVVGVEGVSFFAKQLFGTVEGVRFLVGVVFCLFVGAQLMFEYREEEMRRGIFRRC